MPLAIMVNGLPGKMASEVVKAAAESDKEIEIIPFSLTGPAINDKEWETAGITFKLIHPEARDQEIHAIKEQFGSFICIDYSHPDAVNGNAEYYCREGLPFVMGTTGGDRDALVACVGTSSIQAVIAPNMAKQIVGLQMMLEYAGEHFPGLFSGYSMQLDESHQKGKADTSGTAKAMVSYFNQLGLDFSVDAINKVRDPEVQEKEWNVPAENLRGHAYHTYSLTSADGTVDFQFKHNVRGRRIYALGTLDAAEFLQAKINAGETGVFSMLDVLKSGAME